jgi:serine/threonine-protein kinase RsbW
VKGRFVIYSNPQSIEVVDQIMQQVTVNCRIDELVAFKVRLALSEAINNAILHGNASNPRKQVIIDLEERDDTLYCCVSDEGKGFEVEEILDPRKSENREKEGGRGVLFIKEVAEHFHYCNESHSANFTIRLR